MQLKGGPRTGEAIGTSLLVAIATGHQKVDHLHSEETYLHEWTRAKDYDYWLKHNEREINHHLISVALSIIFDAKTHRTWSWNIMHGNERLPEWKL